MMKYDKNISLRFFINPSQLFRIFECFPALFLVRIYLYSMFKLVCLNFKNNLELQFNARVNIDN